MTDKSAWYAPYVHPAEAIYAKVLSAALIDFAYEPTSFPVEWGKDGEPTRFFTPDFFLPDIRAARTDGTRYDGRYVEITTCRRKLVTRKHRKLRLAKRLYPQHEFFIVYRQDIYRACEEIGLDHEMALLPDQIRRYKDELLELANDGTEH